MKPTKSGLKLAGAVFSSLWAAGAAPVCAQTLPDLVRVSGGLNLGGTSFYDGFGPTTPGFTFINYGRFNFFDQFNNSVGQANPAFTDPSFNTQAMVLQGVYRSPFNLGPGGFGVTAVVPLVNLDARFRPPGVILRDNGFGLGDITFGPFYQADPILVNGRPVFTWRAEFDVIAPSGGFDRLNDINQSAGYWSINPYVTFTYLPTEKIELSARVNYLYNFETSRIANAPTLPGITFFNGQAGEAAWVNYTASYAFTDNLAIGLNGYYLKQFNRNKVNGIDIAGTRQELLYMGPGAHITIDPKNILNLNMYVPVSVDNSPSGIQFNYQYIHIF